MAHLHVSARASHLTTYIKPCIPYFSRSMISYNLCPSATLLHGGVCNDLSQSLAHPPDSYMVGCAMISHNLYPSTILLHFSRSMISHNLYPSTTLLHGGVCRRHPRLQWGACQGQSGIGYACIHI